MPKPATRKHAHVGEVISSLADCLVQRLQPKKILLFGSRAKGDARPGSDIDLAVVGVDPLSFREERLLKEDLDKHAGIYSVDLVFLDGADELFRKTVEETGKIIYEKN